MQRHPLSSCSLWVLLACGLLLGPVGSARDTRAEQKPGPADAVAAKRPEVRKVLFLGNSITLHEPLPAVGWTGNWGMAASAADKDYVHIVTASLAKTSGVKPEIMVRNVADFERQYAGYDVDAKLKEAFEFRADLVIVALGENVPQLATDEAKALFAHSVANLLRGLKKASSPMIVVRSCFWPDPAKDDILKRASQDVGARFVDIGALSRNEANYARSQRKHAHAGVAAHPGDRGMQAIADAILGAIP